MPRSTSAQRAARTGERKRVRNRSIKSVTKTYVGKAEKLIQGSQIESAKSSVLEAISVLDKAVKKNVIHPNTASRRKSRLMKKFNKANLNATAKVEAAETGKTEKVEKKTSRRRSKKE